jgi:hypothetical protein
MVTKRLKAANCPDRVRHTAGAASPAGEGQEEPLFRKDHFEMEMAKNSLTQDASCLEVKRPL